MKLMRFFSLLAFFGIIASHGPLLAEGPLPFGVSVGGQSATWQPGQPFAKIEKPVAADAVLTVATKASLIIVNLHKLKTDNTPDENSQPGVILLQDTDKSSLDQNMEKRKFPPGRYLLSVTGSEATASVELVIQ